MGSEKPTTLSVQQETKDVRTEWAARHILDLREKCKQIDKAWREVSLRDRCCTLGSPALGIENCDDCQPGMFWELVEYCRSELRRSENVRASIKLLDGIAAPVNDAWAMALDGYATTDRFELAWSNEIEHWKGLMKKEGGA